MVMTWAETAPGLFQRPLGGTEIGMLAVFPGDQPPAREYIKIHCVVDFTSASPTSQVVPALRDAWKALRILQSPDIATSFGNGQKSYKVAEVKELEEWLQRTFTVADDNTSVNTAVRDMQLRPSFLPVLSVLPGKTVDETFKGSLILYISHWRTEAAGAFKMIDQLFNYTEDLLTGDATRQALDNFVPGSEIHLLTPTLDDILMPNKEPSSEAKARVAEDFANFYSKLPSIDFPMQGELASTPSYLKVNQRTYTPAATSCLVSACKAQQISVTSSIHSAFLSAVWELADDDKKKMNYASIMPAQVRTRLPLSSPYREQGCWDSARMLLLTASPGQDMLTRARTLKQQYSRTAGDSWMYDDIRQIPVQMMSPPPGIPQTPASFPWFTSIGVLDGEVIKPDHGGIKVSHLTFWADSMSPGIVLRLWTFRKRLSIQIQWNAAFHSDEIIQKTMDIIDRVLDEQLGAKMDIERSDVEEYNG